MYVCMCVYVCVCIYVYALECACIQSIVLLVTYKAVGLEKLS